MQRTLSQKNSGNDSQNKRRRNDADGNGFCKTHLTEDTKYPVD
jgi:hypothetical protein